MLPSGSTPDPRGWWPAGTPEPASQSGAPGRWACPRVGRTGRRSGTRRKDHLRGCNPASRDPVRRPVVRSYDELCCVCRPGSLQVPLKPFSKMYICIYLLYLSKTCAQAALTSRAGVRRKPFCKKVRKIRCLCGCGVEASTEIYNLF